MIPYDSHLHSLLRKIKTNDGYLGQISIQWRRRLLTDLATVEVSPETGLDVKWSLTPEGKKELRRFNGWQRYSQKRKEQEAERPRVRYEPEAPVPLTIEVLDALKSIRDTGEPQTEKLEILARIRRRGGGGPYAEEKDGKWSLTNQGKYQADNHIRKKECAQFTGKVR